MVSLQEVIMNVPLEVTFRGIEKTAEIEALIRANAEKLEKVCSYVSSCRVVVERDQQHQRMGRPFRVRLDITVPPGKEFAVRRESTEGSLHDPLTLVINEAFKAAARRLKKTVDLQREEIRTVPLKAAQGIISKVFPDDGYGFIAMHDGSELYFHANSLVNGGFERLAPGMAVSFTAVEDANGARASTVRTENPPNEILESHG